MPSISTIAINFDDGTGNNDVIPTTHYAGLEFSNAVWVEVNQTFGTFGEGAFSLGVDAGVFGTDPLNNWGHPGPTSPIVIAFPGSISATSFTIQAFDVGSSGAVIEAFDAFGALLDSDSNTGSGLGAGNNPVLTVNAAGIQSVHLRQIANNPPDGLVWDNLSVEVVPEPSGVVLLSIGLSLTLCRRRANKTMKPTSDPWGREKA